MLDNFIPLKRSEEKVEAFGSKHPAKNLIACRSLNGFLAVLERTRRIRMMIPERKSLYRLLLGVFFFPRSCPHLRGLMLSN
jgi:6-phosphogluconate dehydrogenase